MQQQTQNNLQDKLRNRPYTGTPFIVKFIDEYPFLYESNGQCRKIAPIGGTEITLEEGTLLSDFQVQTDFKKWDHNSQQFLNERGLAFKADFCVIWDKDIEEQLVYEVFIKKLKNGNKESNQEA